MPKTKNANIVMPKDLSATLLSLPLTLDSAREFIVVRDTNFDRRCSGDERVPIFNCSDQCLNRDLCHLISDLKAEPSRA